MKELPLWLASVTYMAGFFSLVLGGTLTYAAFHHSKDKITRRIPYRDRFDEKK